MNSNAMSGTSSARGRQCFGGIDEIHAEVYTEREPG